MKNQYFGDAHDYFKYQVLDALATKLSRIDQLTCLWMITGPVEKNHGRVPWEPHLDLAELNNFFSEHEEFRRVWRARNYFGNRPYNYYPHFDRDDEQFESNRSGYFQTIPPATLHHAVVFFDPDTGMEPGQRLSSHLGFDELQSVLSRMDHHSIAVIYQHSQRSALWRQEMMVRLAAETGMEVTAITDSDVAFMVLALTNERIQNIDLILDEVRRRGGADGARRRYMLNLESAVSAIRTEPVGEHTAISAPTAILRSQSPDIQVPQTKRFKWRWRLKGRQPEDPSPSMEGIRGEGTQTMGSGAADRNVRHQPISSSQDTETLRGGRTETTRIGYVNRNRQENQGSRGLPGTDNNQYSYKLKCLRCDFTYGANGSDIHLRLCPRCQGGRPGINY